MAGQTSEANKVFESYLELSEFFNRHQDHILDKLQECDEIAESAGRNKEMIFFAESLPIIDGLIQIGTTRKEYQEALDKVKEEVAGWGSQEPLDKAKVMGAGGSPPLKVDPANIISALTFEYVVAKGLQIAEAEEKARTQRGAAAPQEKAKRDKKVWQRIKQRVDKLTGQGPGSEPRIEPIVLS